MPKFEQFETVSQIITQGGSKIQFSAVRPDKLKSNEQTLVTLVIDETGSVAPFATDLLNMLQSVIESCQLNPNIDSLTFRVLAFNSVTKIREIHGFRQLHDVQLNDYKRFRPDGSTPLYDAALNAIASTVAYGGTLTQQGMVVNALIVIVTDGEDNASSSDPQDILQEVQKARQKENLDSLLTILVGINTQDKRIVGLLKKFQEKAEIDAYIDAGEATPHRLAQLMKFISDSIGAQSSQLGTGQQSSVLPFPPS